MMSQLHQIIKQMKHLNLSTIKMNKNRKDKLISTFLKQIMSITSKYDFKNIHNYRLLIFLVNILLLKF